MMRMGVSAKSVWAMPAEVYCVAYSDALTPMKGPQMEFNRTSFFEPSNTLMCNFTAYVKDDSEISTNGEIDAYEWFAPEEARRNIRPNSLAERFLNTYLDEIL